MTELPPRVSMPADAVKPVPEPAVLPNKDLPDPAALGIDINPPTTFEPLPYVETEMSVAWNQARIRQADENLSRYMDEAWPVLQDMYANVFSVRQGDRLMVVVDSGTALDAVSGVVRVAASDSRIEDVRILYMRTKDMDDISVARDWLRKDTDQLKLANGRDVAISMHDMMSTTEKYREGLMEYWKNEPTFSVSFQMDNYQIRFSQLAPMAQLLGPQVLSPGLTLKECTLPLFGADRKVMAENAAAYGKLMDGAQSVRILSDEPNGTDFTYYPSRDWVDEVANRYDTRRDPSIPLEEVKRRKELQHSTDNLPDGEEWTILPKTERRSQGRLELRLFDTEISAQAVARGDITPEEAARINFDADDPVYCDVEDGYIVRIYGNEGSRRAELLRKHFEIQKSQDNDRDTNDGVHFACLYIAEPGAGVNQGVTTLQVITGELPTLGSEKQKGVLHFGIGNNYDPDEPSHSQSKYHLDFGIFGKSVYLEITKKNGEVWRLKSDQYGVFDYSRYEVVHPAQS